MEEVLTGLRTGVEESARGLDRHGGQRAVSDLRTRVASSSRAGEFI
jgi:hypothetical protein